jgi:hypothetical protein
VRKRKIHAEEVCALEHVKCNMHRDDKKNVDEINEQGASSITMPDYSCMNDKDG